MLEPTTTMTAVKTKTVTRTQMAVALACLGASIIAAAAMSIAGNPSNICLSNAKINVALTLGQGELVSACKGQLIVSTPKFSQLLVRNYTDDTLSLIVDKKFINFKVGEDYKPVGKPIGDALLYQQNLYVAYSGKVDKKADINLFYGYPAGEKGTFCSDTDESQKNFDGSSIKDFKFVNPYVKGTASYYDEETDEMVPTEDSCITYDYGYYGEEAAAITNNLQEGYCSTADGGKWFSKVITCEGGCVDGACAQVVTSTLPIKTCDEALSKADEYFALCKQSKFDGVCLNKYNLFFQTCTDKAGSDCIINNSSAVDNMVCPTAQSNTPTSTQQVGIMNLVSGGKLATDKLKAGENEVAKLSFKVTNEDVVINQLIFTFDFAGNAKPEQIQSVVLKNNVGNVVGGPQIVKQSGDKYQVVLQNPPTGLFTLSPTKNESLNFSLYATVNDPALFYDPVSGFKVSIDPVKDVTAVGSKTLSSIKSASKTFMSWQMMYGNTQPVLTVSSSTPYYSCDAFLSVPGDMVDLLHLTFSNSSTEAIEVTSIGLEQLDWGSNFSSPNDLASLWINLDGDTVSQDYVPLNTKPVIPLKSGGLIIPGNQNKTVVLKGTVAPISPSGSTPGHRVQYVAQVNSIKAKSVDSGLDTKVEYAKNVGSAGPFISTYIFKSYPIITKEKVESNKLVNGTRDLYKFKVVAVSDSISLYRLDFYMETSVAKVSDLYLYDITNSAYGYETQVNTTPGKLVSNVWSTKGDDWSKTYGTWVFTVSKDNPRTLVLRGNVSGATTGAAISTKLVGPKMANYFYWGSPMGTAQELDSYFSGSNPNTIIWSDISVVPNYAWAKDWTNAICPILPKNGGQFETLAY